MVDFNVLADYLYTYTIEKRIRKTACWLYYHELLARQGAYARLHRAQFAEAKPGTRAAAHPDAGGRPAEVRTER